MINFKMGHRTRNVSPLEFCFLKFARILFLGSWNFDMAQNRTGLSC
jgi:hypothetical protein